MKESWQRLARSRKFLIAAMDALIALIVYFAGKYLSASSDEDVLKVIGVLQPVVVMMIYAIAKEDAARGENRER